ncbi:MAG: thioredoxin fold domain-containing protein [Saprospiraceae bacterium]|nr:thioredoxin fold domain-containing protein [Saprospiraceae bacterium]
MKCSKFILIVFICLISLTTLISQEKINWLSWDEMVQMQKKAKKKIVVDLFTDWCGWCKKMDKTTFENPVVIKYINENFYPVKFNAEQTEELVFEGKKYKFVNQGRRGYHEFAAALTQNQLSYPTYVFMDEEIQLLQVIPGYQEAKSFEYIINFFGGNFYKSVPWTKFEKEFQSRL